MRRTARPMAAATVLIASSSLAMRPSGSGVPVLIASWALEPSRRS